MVKIFWLLPLLMCSILTVGQSVTLTCHRDNEICKIDAQYVSGTEDDSIVIATDFPSPFEDFTDLQIFHTDMTYFPKRLCSLMINLKKISVTVSQIVDLTQEAFGSCTKVESLKIHFSQIGSLPSEVFSLMSSITSIDITNIDIHEIASDAFEGLPNLTFLSIANSLTFPVMPTINDLVSLTTFVYSHNGAVEIPRGYFSHNPLLTMIDISSNPLDRICGNVFDGLLDLQQLNVIGPCVHGQNFSIADFGGYSEFFNAITESIQHYLENCEVIFTTPRIHDCTGHMDP